MGLTEQYQIAKERAERFVRANGLEPLWKGQAALDVVTLHTDIYDRGMVTAEEQARRVALRIEWLSRIKAPPLDGIQFGYRSMQ